jgi:carbon storage regulator CsrA
VFIPDSANANTRRTWNVLIVTRRPKQALKIGPDVRITVLEIRGTQVRIGVAAPPTTLILRREIFTKQRSPRHEEPGANR